MYIFQVALISGVMVGIECRFSEEKAPYDLSIVLDLFIIRLIFQKLK